MSRQTFDLIDSDGSGTLETGELEEWFRMCGAELDLSTLLEVLVGGQVSSQTCQTIVVPQSRRRPLLLVVESTY